MSEDLKVHDSSGNVFQDMGMPGAEECLPKAELARLVRKTVRERGLTQKQSAEILGAKQPDVSDHALDMEIRIQVGPRPSWKERAGITVEVVGSF